MAVRITLKPKLFSSYRVCLDAWSLRVKPEGENLS